MNKIAGIVAASAGCIALSGSASLAGPGSCGASASSSPVMAVSMEARDDVVDVAVNAGQFKTLVAAVKAAGLVEALKGDGPFTVFAPTDQAFAKLPSGTVESLLKPENIDTLRAILTYHVVPGRVPASEVVGLAGAGTLNGQRVDFEVGSSGVTVDGARVVKTDIDASNGVIHVIDRVIMPSTSNIVETASQAGSFSTLLKAATEAGLAPTLAEGGPFTVFAPTDAAFEKLGMRTVGELLEPRNREKLRSILSYHVVPGRVYASDAVVAGRAATLHGDRVPCRIIDGRLKIGDAGVVKSDIETSNGVIHVIDTVLVPGN